MRRSRTTAARPIAINPSTNGHGPCHGDEKFRKDVDDDYMLSNGENRFLHENYEEINSGIGGLTVGSLPCVRRGRRSVVSSGGNEILFNDHAHVGDGFRWAQNKRQENNGKKKEMVARSVPVPCAPFLSSRKDYEIENSLSRLAH